jgi:hypothetical protein
MGYGLNGAWYKSFINCQKNPAGRVGQFPTASIDSWTTSCALYVRAVLYWCGKPTNVAVNGSGIFTYLGGVSYGHEAWTKFTAKEGPAPKPFPGAIFYVASHPQANDGHVGVFLREIEPGVWETAEGGGNAPGGKPGTTCTRGKRSLKPGTRFDSYRVLLGWFDPAKMGLPPSPPRPTVINLPDEDIDDDPTPVNWGVPLHPDALPSRPELPPPPLPKEEQKPTAPETGKTVSSSLTGIAVSSCVAAILTALITLAEHCR